MKSVIELLKSGRESRCKAIAECEDFLERCANEMEGYRNEIQANRDIIAELDQAIAVLEGNKPPVVDLAANKYIEQKPQSEEDRLQQQEESWGFGVRGD